MVLQQSVEVFFISRKRVCLISTKQQQKNSCLLQKEQNFRGRGQHQAEERGGKKCKKKNLRRFVFQISRFLRHFFLLFSLFVRRVCWSFSLSSRTHRISHLPSDRLPRARCALLGFQTREREKERRNKSSVAIINTNNNNNKV